MDSIGSMRWARRHGGRLTAWERLRFLGSAVQSQLHRALLRWRGPLPLGAARLDLALLRFPDTRQVTEAFQVCEAAYEPWLMNHCLRTYLWGGLVGQLEQREVEIEALLIAALFHDLGLTARGKAAGQACFAVRGAQCAEELLSGAADPGLAPAVAGSIAMHLNAAVSPAEPALNYLLHQGAAIDVVGWDLGKVRSMKDEVLARHPRLGFKRRLQETLAGEARAHPGTRLAMMIRFGFLGFVERAPFEE